MMVATYPKIETYFDRNKTDFTVNIDVVRCPEFNQIASWLVTEKIDGMNIRVALKLVQDGNPDYPEHYEVKFYGRTDGAQMPAHMYAYLSETFTYEKMISLWRDGCHEIVLFGEGYGEKIQNGGDYRHGVSFRMFDILIAKQWWLDWDNVSGIAEKLDIKTVPLLSHNLNLIDIVAHVNEGFLSVVANEEGGVKLAEGIVARTNPYLYDKKHNPIKFKLKTKDFIAGKYN